MKKLHFCPKASVNKSPNKPKHYKCPSNGFLTEEKLKYLAVEAGA